MNDNPNTPATSPDTDAVWHQLLGDASAVLALVVSEDLGGAYTLAATKTTDTYAADVVVAMAVAASSMLCGALEAVTGQPTDRFRLAHALQAAAARHAEAAG